MGLMRDIELLEPRTRDAAYKALAALRALGIKYWVNETLRSAATQEAYFAQGRELLDVVNAKRKAAGLWVITEADNHRQITQTLKSKHLEGKALDLVPQGKDGGPHWAAEKREYLKIADIMSLFGFEWGGNWKGFEDCPHFQIKETP